MNETEQLQRLQVNSASSIGMRDAGTFIGVWLPNFATSAVPVVIGKTNTWACDIIYSTGRVNFFGYKSDATHAGGGAMQTLESEPKNRFGEIDGDYGVIEIRAGGLKLGTPKPNGRQSNSLKRFYRGCSICVTGDPRGGCSTGVDSLSALSILLK